MKEFNGERQRQYGRIEPDYRADRFIRTAETTIPAPTREIRHSFSATAGEEYTGVIDRSAPIYSNRTANEDAAPHAL
jgi:hypothetical protein